MGFAHRDEADRSWVAPGTPGCRGDARTDFLQTSRDGIHQICL
jgi:hypothetical protein